MRIGMSLARVHCRLAEHVLGNSRRIVCHRVDLLLACGQSGILSCGRNDGIEPLSLKGLKQQKYLNKKVTSTKTASEVSHVYLHL